MLKQKTAPNYKYEKLNYTGRPSSSNNNYFKTFLHLITLAYSSTRSKKFNIKTRPTLKNIKYLLLFLLWYSASAVTNNIGKQILVEFKYPITLTFIQFGFVSLFAYIFSLLFKNGSKIQKLDLHVINSTAPLSLFQIVGHIFSSISYTYIAVSFAHTIKALAPLFTVLIYRIFWQVIYSRRIYLSLVPLTVGVMLVCSSNVKFHSIGFFCSLMSTLIFATQNIFSKKLFLHARHANLEQIQTKLNKNNQNNSLNSPINTTAQNIGNKVADLKLDKLNLLFYSAFLAFILMFPIWMYTEGIQFFTDYSILPSMKVSFLFLLNGVTNFTQNMFAFTILSLVSPVTYSIASLVKRIFVITASIIWFGDSVSKLQGFGIFLTFLGLWMYDQARMDVAKSEARLNLTESTTLTLPTTNILNKNRDEEEKSRSWNKDSIPRSNSFNKNINLNEIYSRGSYLKEVY